MKTASLLITCLFLFQLPCISADKIVEKRGGRVSVVMFEDGSWQLQVNGKPYFIKGLEYSADKVGMSSPGVINEWMSSDEDGNGKIDGPYDSWIDANCNNVQDENEKPVGDFELIKEMGCNTIRIYHPDKINVELLRKLYDDFGIMVIMGNFFGAYTVGSDAEWAAGTDYTDEGQKQNMRESVRQMVETYKDEPFVLMWMLGNENDSAGSSENSTLNNTNASKEPQAYAEFLNEVCRMIKEMDPDHPIGVCNSRTKLLSYYEKFAPEIDIVGFNSYTGAYGFGGLFNYVGETFDRPVIITEYGCDAYDMRKDAVDEDFQAKYHKKAWQDMEDNSYWGARGAGNSIGGCAYNWLDRWWLCGSPSEHDIAAGAWQGPTNDGYFNDEWLGICSQGDGSKSPFLRQPRKVYFVYKDLWKNAVPKLQQ